MRTGYQKAAGHAIALDRIGMQGLILHRLEKVGLSADYADFSGLFNAVFCLGNNDSGVRSVSQSEDNRMKSDDKTQKNLRKSAVSLLKTDQI